MEIEISPIQLSPGRVIVSRILSGFMTVTAVALLVVYVMNVWCVAADPTRAMLTGRMWHEVISKADGSTSATWGKSGMSRAFVEEVPKEDAAFLTLGGTRIALPNMTIGAWMLYLLFLTLSLAVGLLFLISLARLFQGFARGKIFTKASIRQIQWTGIAVLLGGILQFGSAFFAMGINALCAHDLAGFSGQSYGSSLDFPLAPFVCAAMIILTALMFEEGRKLSEEASLTI